MNESVQFLSDNARRFFQFEESELQPAIMRVTGCSASEAMDSGKKHCNMLSKWLCLAATKMIDYDYEEFFRKAYELKLCTQNGYISAPLKDFFSAMDINVSSHQYTDFKSIPDSVRKPGACFQIPINGFKHWMATGIDDDGKAYLFCTHNLTYRPYGAELSAALAVHKDKIDCVKQYV